jgi:hypothetical protein
MFRLTIEANTIEELQEQLKNAAGLCVGYQYHPPVGVDTLVTVPAEEQTEIKPVITMDKAEENEKNAPVHEEPPVPSLDEVRAAFRTLKDKKGSDAVKAILKDYGANTVPGLKEEDRLGAMERALAEVS